MDVAESEAMARVIIDDNSYMCGPRSICCAEWSGSRPPERFVSSTGWRGRGGAAGGGAGAVALPWWRPPPVAGGRPRGSPVRAAPSSPPRLTRFRPRNDGPSRCCCRGCSWALYWSRGDSLDVPDVRHGCVRTRGGSVSRCQRGESQAREVRKDERVHPRRDRVPAEPDAGEACPRWARRSPPRDPADLPLQRPGRRNRPGGYRLRRGKEVARRRTESEGDVADRRLRRSVGAGDRDPRRWRAPPDGWRAHQPTVPELRAPVLAAPSAPGSCAGA